MKFHCPGCEAPYVIGDDKVAGKTMRMKCRKCGKALAVTQAGVTEDTDAATQPAPGLKTGSVGRPLAAARPGMPAAPKPAAASSLPQPGLGSSASTGPKPASRPASALPQPGSKLGSPAAPRVAPAPGLPKPGPAAGTPRPGAAPLPRAASKLPQPGGSGVTAAGRTVTQLSPPEAAASPVEASAPLPGVHSPEVPAPPAAAVSAAAVAVSAEVAAVSAELAAPAGVAGGSSALSSAAAGGSLSEDEVWAGLSSLGGAAPAAPEPLPSSPLEAAASLGAASPAAASPAAASAAASPAAASPAAASPAAASLGAASPAAASAAASPAAVPAQHPPSGGGLEEDFFSSAAPTTDEALPAAPVLHFKGSLAPEPKPETSQASALEGSVLLSMQNWNPQARAKTGKLNLSRGGVFGIVLASFGAGLLVGALAFGGRDVRLVEKVVEVSRGPAQAEDVPPPPSVEGAAGPADPGALAQAGPAATRSRPGVAAPANGAPAAEAPALPALTNLSGPGLGGPSVGPGAGPQGGNSTLEAAQIQATVTKFQASVKRGCWQPALDTRDPGASSSARVNVSLTVLANGSVQSAKASPDPAGYHGLSACIERRVSSWEFPRSSGSTSVNIPFVFAAQ